MTPKNRYIVRDSTTGEIVCVGTAAQCSAFLGITPGSVYQLVHRAAEEGVPCITRGHTLEQLFEPESVPRSRTPEEQAAITAWDAFTEPLRKRFGIPVYKPKEK